MSRARRTILATSAAVLFLIACGVAGFFRLLSKRPEPRSAELVVPASWAEFRTSTGHQQHVGKFNVVCKDCHAFESSGFTNPGAGVCNRCHGAESMHTHAGGERKTDCLACHSFGPREPAPTCIGCHAQVQGTHASIVQHASVECNECHHPHATPPIAPKDCTSCHEERALSHANHAESRGCQDCHRAHQPGKAALGACSTCHERPSGPKPAGHDSCMSCHKPHDFVAQPATVCVGCHGMKPTLVAASVATHTRCTSCHRPHAPALAALSCVGCHSQVHVVHASKAACTSCHQPHSGDVEAKSSSCTSCHASVAASDNGAHAGRIACTNCHKPHAFPAIPRGQLCGSCHGSEMRLASENRGHHECASCHGASAHKPVPAPTCDTCHRGESATAPLGHRNCRTCHEPHGGGRIPEATTCTNCHTNKTSVLHASIQGGCETCHRPHGPNGPAAPPACTSCHERAKLPALHVVASHGECSQCHAPHAPPRSDRVTCTGSCHANRRNHQPAAEVCSGCHVFRI